MTNHDRAIYGGAWALILSGIAVILALAVHPMGAHASEVTHAAGHSLPSWAHWKTAPRGACGHGNPGIVVWAGHGDGVLICANGDVETS